MKQALAFDRSCVLPYLVTPIAGCSQLPSISSGIPALPKQMLARQVLVTLPDTLKPKWPAIRAELAKRHAISETGEFPLTSIGVDCLVYTKCPNNFLWIRL